MTGRILNHYRVLEKLGAGGMGEVYRARDERLGREVAIKLLPQNLARESERLARFEREARLLASLNHPNIAAIYGLEESDGIPFFVLELVPGATLAEKLAADRVGVKEALRICRQIAEALEAAHEKGVVHRDLKPGNVKVTPEGKVKVLDFGLAKAFKVEAPSVDLSKSPTLSKAATQAGVIFGTPAYMSPEQARGKPVDKRTDIWAFGCVLYEVLTGCPAFRGETVTDTVAAILDREPNWQALPETTPQNVQALLRRCLQKDVNRRLRDIGDACLGIEDALANGEAAFASLVAAPRARRARKTIDSIAVLPLENASGDPEAEYLSDGVTESIIYSLSKLPKLRVIARSMAFRYKGRTVDPKEVGKQLNVGAVLTGRVTQRGETLHIGAELVDVAGGWQLWGAQYDRSLAQIFAVQDEVAREITEKLRLQLTGEEKKRLRKRYTENVEAYQAYLRGRYHWNKRTVEGLKKSLEHFQQAVEKDPTYALAYAGLADTYALLGIAEYGLLPPAEVMPRAKAAAIKALEIDHSLAEAQTQIAHLKAFYEWDWMGAEQEFKRAFELNPNYAFSHHWYACYLAAMDRPGEAIAEEEQAQELDPLSLIINKNVGTIYYYARQYDEAIAAYQKALELDPNFARTHFFLGFVYEQKGMFDEAITAFEKAISASGRTPVMAAALGHTYAFAGKKQRAQEILAELKERSAREYVPALSIATIYAGLGENAPAFKWLEKACEERSSWLLSLKVDPLFDGLRSDSRFADLVHRIGLPA